MRLVVTSTAGNAVDYAARCIRSVANQRTEFGPSGQGRGLWHCYSSSDGPTHLEAVATARESTADITCTLDTGSPLARLVPLWLSLHPADVVIWLDGDDELGEGAAERVAKFYELEGVWMTYGSFVRDDGQIDYQVSPVFGRRYHLPPRSSSFRASHLRTFRAGLVTQLIPEMLRDNSGEYFKAAPDVAVMVALLELVGERYLVSTDVLCRYNYAHAAKGPEAVRAQRMDVEQIATRRPLERLRERPW